MRYATDDTYYWYCEDCAKRWDHNPELYHCPECADEGFKAKVLPFTRDDWKNKKAELDMDSSKE
jgi:hypothetical protein